MDQHTHVRRKYRCPLLNACNELVAVGLDFLETLTTESSKDRTKLSFSSYSDRFSGSNFVKSNNSPLCISLMYYAGMSWKGEAKLTPAARVALSVSGTISEGGR